MRMIEKYESRSEADERAAFLRSRGIATHVTDMTSLRLNLAHQGRFRAGLWVLLEDHFEDAAKLLEDPDHTVANPLSEYEMERLETEGAAGAQQTMMKWLLLIGAGLAVIAVLVLLLGG